ncbi:hypothetical protein JTE90_024409 [Oedothorax gibbosus]|uniref:Uncharacterized protein n=1 Tax=Oedothorax gibbosus TaxID=931172 RepID=A0AAV6TDW3_9ARAC|nr:hypothetical protein JTE90_024409 [Oedothorax gibbosus]
MVPISSYAARTQISTIDLHVRNRTDLHQEFPWHSSCPGIVHILFRVHTSCAQTPPLPQVERRRVSGAAPPGDVGNGDSRMCRRPHRRPCTLHFAAGLIQDPLTRALLDSLGQCFKHGFFATFPHGTCLPIGLRKYLALGGVYHPIRCTSKQPDSKAERNPDRT